MRTKIQQTIAEAFLNQTLWKLPDCLFLFIQTKIIVLNDLISKSIMKRKALFKNYNIIVTGKNFYDQSIDYSIKRYEEIRKPTIGQCEDYTKGCSLDYECVNNHYKLIAVDLTRQKELYVDPKAS